MACGYALIGDWPHGHPGARPGAKGRVSRLTFSKQLILSG